MIPICDDQELDGPARAQRTPQAARPAGYPSALTHAQWSEHAPGQQY
jgi:hypothetical protein